jgi:DEAD/DEAH box helicase domain-containing protein
VLQPFADFDVKSLPNLDLMLDLKEVAGFRPSLGNCCQATWGEAKSASGLQSLQWWREGRHEEVIAYCRHDVALTRRLHEWGAQHGHILCLEKTGRHVLYPSAGS